MNQCICFSVNSNIKIIRNNAFYHVPSISTLGKPVSKQIQWSSQCNSEQLQTNIFYDYLGNINCALTFSLTLCECIIYPVSCLVPYPNSVGGPTEGSYSTLGFQNFVIHLSKGLVLSFARQLLQLRPFLDDPKISKCLQ